MDHLWTSVALLFGFAARQIGLPVLVGLLVAGFVLKALGAEGGPFLKAGELATHLMGFKDLFLVGFF